LLICINGIESTGTAFLLYPFFTQKATVSCQDSKQSFGNKKIQITTLSRIDNTYGACYIHLDIYLNE
jgi:hypothetical protein